MIDSADQQFLMALVSGSLSQDDFLTRSGARLRFGDLGSLKGIVYVSGMGNIYIVINNHLTLEGQRRTFLHEIHHILDDIPSYPCLISIDMQGSVIEKDSERFVSLMAVSF